MIAIHGAACVSFEVCLLVGRQVLSTFEVRLLVKKQVLSAFEDR